MMNVCPISCCGGVSSYVFLCTFFSSHPSPFKGKKIKNKAVVHPSEIYYNQTEEVILNSCQTAVSFLTRQ